MHNLDPLPRPIPLSHDTVSSVAFEKWAGARTFVIDSTTSAPLLPQELVANRLVYWIAAGLGWIVWTFAVAASADDAWLNVDGLKVADQGVLDFCSIEQSEDSDDVCNICETFDEKPSSHVNTRDRSCPPVDRTSFKVPTRSRLDHLRLKCGNFFRRSTKH